MRGIGLVKIVTIRLEKRSARSLLDIALSHSLAAGCLYRGAKLHADPCDWRQYIKTHLIRLLFRGQPGIETRSACQL